MRKPSRVTVFIDYENLHRGALDCFHPSRTSRSLGHIDPLQLGHLLIAKRTANGLDSTLQSVRVYRGRPDARFDRRSAAVNDRQAAAWSRMDRVTVIRRPLRYPRGWPRVPAQEKGIDVALAVDLVSLAFLGVYDVGIVVSSDSDLLPALETVTQITPARTEVMAWRGQSRLSYADGRKLWCHWLDENEYRAVEDPVNYTKRPGGGPGH